MQSCSPPYRYIYTLRHSSQAHVLVTLLRAAPRAPTLSSQTTETQNVCSTRATICPVPKCFTLSSRRSLHALSLRAPFPTSMAALKMQRQTSLSSLRKSRPLLLQKIRAICAVPLYSIPMSADESEDELDYREKIEKEVQIAWEW